jgi:hypothetical protein
MYYIETRLRNNWQRVHVDNHATLDDAVRALERLLDQLFFEHNVTIQPNNFRIVKVRK